MSRTSPVVAPGSVEEFPWLRDTLNTTGIIGNGEYDNEGLRKILEKTLSSPDAIWTLCSLMVQRAPDSQLLTHPNWLLEAISNHHMMHIQAHVVQIQGHELMFKLTPETISELTEYYKDIYLTNIAAMTRGGWSNEFSKLQDQFASAVNEFVYRTGAEALLNLEPDGSGELSCGNSNQAKTAIMGLFRPPSPADVNLLSAVQIIQRFANQQLTSDNAPHMPSFLESPGPVAL